MVIPHKPASFADNQLKMPYAFNRLRGVALDQILPHVCEDRMIGLQDRPAFVPLSEEAFGYHNQVINAERKMREIEEYNRAFSQYYAEFRVITANLDCNRFALQNALRMGLSEEMRNSFTYSDMPKEFPAVVMVCQKRDNLIHQQHAEKAAQIRGGGGIGFASPRPPPPQKASEMAPAGPGAGYTEPAPTDLGARERRILVEVMVKVFVDGR